MELHQIDLLAAAVFRDFQQIDHAVETRSSRQLRRDVVELDLAQRIDFDHSGAELVAIADAHARTLPDAHADGDVAVSDTFVQDAA